jgi:tetratricopeptide (TPR) repeat protein
LNGKSDSFFNPIFVKIKKMKTILTLLSLALISNVWSQDLPQKSSNATVEQKVGLTEISINYSRPNVNGRVIFGELVPFGEVWRLGANQPTKITLSYPISINNQDLDTGTYAIYAIPEANQWNVVFNSDHKQWGSSSYDPEKNVLEYSTAVSVSEYTESFTISFESVNETSANLVFEWASAKVSVPFTTETLKAVEAGIEAKIAEGEDLGKVYFNAADFFNDEGDLDKAKMYLEKSQAIERTYYNVYLEGNMMKGEDLKAALKLAEEAAGLADSAEKEGWANYIRRKSGEWK